MKLVSPAWKIDFVLFFSNTAIFNYVLWSGSGARFRFFGIALLNCPKRFCTVNGLFRLYQALKLSKALHMLFCPNTVQSGNRAELSSRNWLRKIVEQIFNGGRLLAAGEVIAFFAVSHAPEEFFFSSAGSRCFVFSSFPSLFDHILLSGIGSIMLSILLHLRSMVDALTLVGLMFRIRINPCGFEQDP